MRHIVKVAINVPSGRLVFGNDFRREYPINGSEFNINESVGIKQTIEAYAAAGMFHGFCGNSCPTVYKKNGTIYIASPEYNKKLNKSINPKLGKEVGSICTDLWWYSVADYYDYVYRGGDIEGSDYIDIVDVKPGRYVLSHDLSYVEWPKKHIYATIKRSDEKIVPWKMPEEGAAEEVMKLLPPEYLVKKEIDIPPPNGADEDYIKYWKDEGHDKHIKTTRLYVKTAYKKPKVDDYITPWKKIGYELWGNIFDGTNDQFIHVKATAEQIQNYKYMAKKAIEDFKEVIEEERIHKELMAADTTKMTPKELAEHSKKQMESFDKRCRRFDM